MSLAIAFGNSQWELKTRAEHLIPARSSHAFPPVVSDLPAMIAHHLEHPVNYPALRQALTPDDQIAMVVDEHLPHLAEIVTAVLDYLVQNGVDPSRVHLVVPQSSSHHEWLPDLPERYRGFQLEIHDADDRPKLAYLASTKSGHRLYLNRTVVDADELICIHGPRFDPMMGYLGPATVLYPALFDRDSQKHWQDVWSRHPSRKLAKQLAQEAEEATWLLGTPFYLQIFEGSADSIVHVQSGTMETAAAARSWLDQFQHVRLPHRVDLVIATLKGNPERQDVEDLARALANASQIVAEDGAIVLLSDTHPDLGPGFHAMQSASDPRDLLHHFQRHPPHDWSSTIPWLETISKNRVYMNCRLKPELTESLGVTPLTKPEELARLIETAQSTTILENAHKTFATLAD